MILDVSFSLCRVAWASTLARVLVTPVSRVRILTHATPVLLSPLCFLFLFSASLFAADTWNLTTADFQTRSVQLTGIDSKAIKFDSADSHGQVAIDQFLQLDRGQIPQISSERWVLHLSGGDRIAGQPLSSADEKIQWEHPILGKLQFPLRRVQAITMQNSAAPDPAQTRKEDAVTLANGDNAKGIISTISSTEISIQTETGEMKIPLASATAVYFAGVSPASDDRPAFRLRLSDNSILAVSALRFADEQFTIQTSDGTSCTIPSPNILTIEQINGPVSWLSSRLPSENIQQSFGDLSWPARMDRSVTNQPIRFGDHTYSRGIGVHSYSRISYPLAGSFKFFRTQYAIDGNGPYADVTVRIKLDGKTVHEQEHLTAGKLSPVVQHPLKDAKSLTLEVDYGANHDIQDRFNWIEPALLRIAPTTQPTTNPK